MDKAEAHDRLSDLIAEYEQQVENIRPSQSSYNETQLRNDYLNDFLEILGWDVNNKKSAPQHLREVVQEESIDVDSQGESTKKNPDYTLRVRGERRTFLEAKKPSVRVESNSDAAYQTRQYGWNAGLDISFLSNFHHLVVYDCRYRPEKGDAAHVARYAIFEYTEYLERFDELWELVSRQAVMSGRQIFKEEEQPTGAQTFDEFFLAQIEEWRSELAQDLIQRNEGLSERELNFLVQRLINRIIFLRICEDRELEIHERLLEVESYDQLKEIFYEADDRYNSGLFDFIEDKLSMGVDVSSEVLTDIFSELYYPESPYNFAVVDASILGKIYDLFLGREIRKENETVSVDRKPEVVASGGVVPTPPYVVNEIVSQTLAPLCEGKSPEQLKEINICDICCGSGTFLLAAYEYLINRHQEWYTNNNPEEYSDSVVEGPDDTWELTLREKRRILVETIHGIDIDEQAVEVTRFSLLLKVLEGESREAVDGYISEYGRKALPSLRENIKVGNSLVDSDYFRSAEDIFDIQHYDKVRPFDWQDEFEQTFDKGGFDAIVGNPPYVRIQNLVAYTPQEVEFYRSTDAPYRSADQDNFDKYYLFVERALNLLNEEGRLGYILPHKFFSIKAGETLRCILSEGSHVHSITHFGVQQVFPGHTTYTAILILGKSPREEFKVERIDDVEGWRVGREFPSRGFQSESISCDPWVFVSREAEELFARIREADNTAELQEIADIPVGLQTSADHIYIISEDRDEVYTKKDQDGRKLLCFEKRGESWCIEHDIVRPALYDQTITPFEKPEANAWMIFPYEVADGKANLYTEEQMESRFPRCWDYLDAHREKLEGRSIRGGEEKWYQYGRTQSLTKFDGSDKLIWSTLATRTPYAYDDAGSLFTGGGNGPYYMLRPKSQDQLPEGAHQYSIFYLLAVLSDPIIESMVKARASDFRGGYYSHGKQFIKTLPIRSVDFDDADEVQMYNRTVDLSRRLVNAVQGLKSATLPAQRRALKGQIKELRFRLAEQISDLYGFDGNDYRSVTEGNLFLSPPVDEEDGGEVEKLDTLPSFLVRNSGEVDELNLST